MAGRSVAIKGGKAPMSVPSPSSGMHNDFVLGSRPGVLRAPPISRPPNVKPGAASTRNYGKPDPTQPFGALGGGNTGMGGLS
jgi:hypothetical protein